MSLFRKPKKIQRRVFSSTLDEDDERTANEARDSGRSNSSMYIGGDLEAPPPPTITVNKKLEKKEKSKDGKNKQSSKASVDNGSDAKNTKGKALLSFADDEDDAEVFQVRKSSHSKKMMRMLDKERRKKKRSGRDDGSNLNDDYQENGRSSSTNNIGSKVQSDKSNPAAGSKFNRTTSSSSTATISGSNTTQYNKSKKSDSIQTEIRTDDFVLVVKKSEPELILNGRAAVCAGRNDLSDEDMETQAQSDTENDGGRHRFSKPEHFKKILESGSIPDAAMIHAARKRRQKAREQGDFIPVEEPKEVPKKGSRLAREDVEGENSDDEERVDMNAITGVKEREERREQFYSVEHDSSDDSDLETNDWEAQQIRKGVTGAQLVTAQQESVLSRFIIKSTAGALEYGKTPQSTFTLLEQAYAKSALEKPQKLLATTKAKKDKAKMQTLRSPPEIKHALSTRLTKLKELNTQHTADIERITNELKVFQMEQMDCAQHAPTAAAKYRFYQEVKCFVADLIDCLNEKTAAINDLEMLAMQTMSKHQTFLIERRRQDVRDQAKEMAEALKPSSSRRAADNEEQVRRAAEREGRRTRRRCEREKNELLSSHLDGMSSDEETPDHYMEQYKTTIEQLAKDAEEIFNDVNDEFCKVELILVKFYAWRKTDMESYKDAFVSLCLPKVLGPLIRMEIITWSPLNEDYKDIEKMNWYAACMLYAWNEHETEEALKLDPDLNLVPTIIEKIILPKITEIVSLCWDPLSTTQTLRLIGCINRLGRDFPLKETSKALQHLFNTILEKMKAALENDVFIPIFPKQVQEAKTSFFQRQFCSGLKLFRNFLSWQSIIADKPLRELAIASLLNRYLLMAMRVCTANDALSKAYVVVNTLPTAWLQPDSVTLQNMQLFIIFIKQTLETCDTKNPLHMQSLERAKQILQRLHSY